MAGGLPRKGPLTLSDSKRENELPVFTIPIKKKNFKNICNNFILRKLQMLSLRVKVVGFFEVVGSHQENVKTVSSSLV